MNLTTELNKLKSFIGNDTEEFNKQLAIIKQHFTSEEDLKAIDTFIRNGLTDLTADLKEFNSKATLRMQLSEISEIVSLSYIANTYFHKTRHWLYQRINNNVINGKTVKFTCEEINTLNFALHDIGRKIGSVNITM